MDQSIKNFVKGEVGKPIKLQVLPHEVIEAETKKKLLKAVLKKRSWSKEDIRDVIEELWPTKG